MKCTYSGILSLLGLLSSLQASLPPTSFPQRRIHWIRPFALRVGDNEAFTSALQNLHEVIPVYLWDSSIGRTGGTASDVFLSHALASLNATLDGQLVIGCIDDPVTTGRQSSDASTTETLVRELSYISKKSGATEVFYVESPHGAEDDEESLQNSMKRHGLVPRPFQSGCTLLDYRQNPPPWEAIIARHPFRSPLIPFVDYVLDELNSKSSFLSQTPLPVPPNFSTQMAKLAGPKIVGKSISTNELIAITGKTTGGTNWGKSIAETWPASEDAAKEALELFLQSLPPLQSGVTQVGSSSKHTHLASNLSCYLSRGLISVRQVYNSIREKRISTSFVRRLCWRDYTYALSLLFPVTDGRPIRSGYYSEAEEVIDGNDSKKQELLQRWKNGQTGFPLVDAGMRQLQKEGWMPQKVRLAVSACLVEGLRLSWREGMNHFEEYLVDFDPAINVHMWMNAGCVGFDPYYVGLDYKRRPYWDKDGVYVRHWCPEIACLPDSAQVPEQERGIGTFKVDCLYEPWSVPETVLKEAGVVLGETYPDRLCDERSERRRFFADLRERRSQFPASKKDAKGLDMVTLGIDANAAQVAMFTPRALI